MMSRHSRLHTLSAVVNTCAEEKVQLSIAATVKGPLKTVKKDSLRQ